MALVVVEENHEWVHLVARPAHILSAHVVVKGGVVACDTLSLQPSAHACITTFAGVTQSLALHRAQSRDTHKHVVVTVTRGLCAEVTCSLDGCIGQIHPFAKATLRR